LAVFNGKPSDISHPAQEPKRLEANFVLLGEGTVQLHHGLQKCFNHIIGYRTKPAEIMKGLREGTQNIREEKGTAFSSSIIPTKTGKRTP